MGTSIVFLYGSLAFYIELSPLIYSYDFQPVLSSAEMAERKDVR